MANILEVREVSKSFGGVKALSKVSLVVERPTILGLIGPNGSGKTTLINIVTGLVKPDEGRIFYSGVDITGKKPHEIARMGVSRTFQLVRLLPSLSVYDNVLIGARARGLEDSGSRVVDVLRLVGIENLSSRPAGSLNLAEKKKVELARAIVSSPTLLLLDEVLAGLSVDEVAEMLEIIRRIRGEGVAVVIVEHLVWAVSKISERVVALNAGVKIAEGSPEEVLKDPRVVSSYIGGGGA